MVNRLEDIENRLEFQIEDVKAQIKSQQIVGSVPAWLILPHEPIELHSLIPEFSWTDLYRYCRSKLLKMFPYKN